MEKVNPATLQTPESSESKSPDSVCDLMKNNTSQIIKKMESQIPSYIQLYSDYYKEYLHSLDDLFGTCYISEKQFFENLGVDQNTLKTFDNYTNTLTKIFGSQIDISTNLLRAFIQMRISAIKSYDDYIHSMMENYGKLLSQFYTTFKK